MLVLANRDLNQVTWEQRVMAGDPKFEASQNVPDFAFAQLCGDCSACAASRVEKPEEIGAAWDQALVVGPAGRLRSLTDPEVPTLPPHITFKQAKNFAESMFKGDPHWPSMIRGAFKDAVESFHPAQG